MYSEDTAKDLVCYFNVDTYSTGYGEYESHKSDVCVFMCDIKINDRQPMFLFMLVGQADRISLSAKRTHYKRCYSQHIANIWLFSVVPVGQSITLNFCYCPAVLSAVIRITDDDVDPKSPFCL